MVRGTAYPTSAMSDLAAVLRASGRRLTPQRRRIVEALAGLGHATPDAVAAQVSADGGPNVPLSTIYRGLEALESLGVVSHTHLDHRAATYHLTGHADHVHLVCRACGTIDEVPASAATEFVAQISASRGFAADVTHMAVHGVCAECRS